MSPLLPYHYRANMAKRSNANLDADSPYKKRQKLTEQQAVTSVDINIQSSQDLQALLAFKQDTGAEQFRHSMTPYHSCMI